MDVQTTREGQVTKSAAEIYDDFFVPALFREWAPRVADAAGVAPGQHVLDVACGTGVLACEAARRVGPSGRVTGLDRNDGMLAVARRKARGIEWKSGRAESLPFVAAAFDGVVSQFGLMFFEDRVAALQEMWRVLRPGGRLAVAVWSALEQTPGYATMTALLQRLFGERIANELRAPYALGDVDFLRSLFAEAGISQSDVRAVAGTARFPSIASWVHTDVKGWTLADLINERQFRALLQASETELQRFVQPDGSVTFAHPAYVVVAAKAV